MVEWKKIGEICTIIRGNRVTKSDLIENGLYPVISGGVSPLGYIDKYNREPNTITIAQYGSAGYVDIQKEKFWANDVCYSVYPDDEILNKFLFYSLKKEQAYIYSLRTNAVPAHLPQKDLAGIQIPIPSLDEQNRIVGILDTFTSSIDNLKQQIAQRRKQYEYYRDQLLDLEGKEGVEMKSCGEVCEVTDYVANGSFATLRENVSYRQEPDYAVLVRTIDLSNNFDGDKVYIDERAYKFLSKSSLFGGEIIINNIGAGVGQTFRCPCFKEKMSLGPNSILVRTPNNDFYYYWFNSIYGQNAIMKVVTPGAMPKFNKTGFKTITVPVPPLYEQQRIVDILDKFEASIQNLEAQLSQREKQYEYYRNKLLTFE